MFLAFASVAAGALVLVTVVADYTALIRDPAPPIGAIVLLGALAALQRPLLDAETRWRRDAVLDPLTGLLNRQGLPRRFREVAEQARLTAINDAHGHARGDAVLKDVAYALRKTLRSFELLYRVGGEELLIEYASMYETADRALYQAKRAGRNRVAFLPVAA